LSRAGIERHGLMVTDVDPVVAAWAPMGISEIIGLRWVRWDDSPEVPAHVFDEVIALIRRALGATVPYTREVRQR
jgi:hypothetical protein